MKGSSPATAGRERHEAAAREARRRRAPLLADRSRRRLAAPTLTAALRSSRRGANAADEGARARATGSAGGCTRQCACNWEWGGGGGQR